MSSNPLPVADKVTALDLANTMFGDGIKVISATYKGDTRSAGIYTDGGNLMPGVVPSDSGIILSTGDAADFNNKDDEFNQSPSTSSDTKGIDGDKDMDTLAGTKTFDAAFLEATFVPEGDTLTMQLVFSSEEYPEWVKSGFNDVVAIWVNGTLLQLSVGDGTISIDNINEKTNPNLYRDNTDGALNTEMDGLTYVLTLKAPVKPGAENTIKIGIADAGDAIYDSALMIVADSVQTALIAQDDLVAVTTRGEAVVSLLDNDTMTGRDGVVISHLADQAVKVGSVVTLATGDKLLLNADGTITVFATEATAKVIFSYTITDSTGTSDTAFVTVVPSPVDGTEGDDQMAVFYRDAQGNVIDGADGLSEVIFGYGGNDKVAAGFGNDDIYGGNGNDFVRAGDGNDLLDGGEGNDVLDGQLGADTMAGGAGNDVFYINDAGDVVIEGASGGYDKVISDISMTLGANFEELWLREGTKATTAMGNTLANKIIGNSQDNQVSGFEGNDQLFGEDGADVVSGGVGADNLFGGAGDDFLSGEDGNDKVYGGTGSDTLIGGLGSDSLTAGSDGSKLEGGAGRDLLVGGAGQDVFIFATGSGRDTVVDFEAGLDKLVLEGIDPLSVQTTLRGDKLLVSWGTTDLIKVELVGVVSGDLDFFA